MLTEKSVQTHRNPLNETNEPQERCALNSPVYSVSVVLATANTRWLSEDTRHKLLEDRHRRDLQVMKVYLTRLSLYANPSPTQVFGELPDLG